MMSASRSAKLQSLQKMAEMQEFLEFITEEGQWWDVLCQYVSRCLLKSKHIKQVDTLYKQCVGLTSAC